MLQVDIKGKEGVVHRIWTVQSMKDVLDTRKPPEKIEVEESQETPRPAGPKALGRQAWPLFKPSGAPL